MLVSGASSGLRDSFSSKSKHERGAWSPWLSMGTPPEVLPPVFKHHRCSGRWAHEPELPVAQAPLAFEWRFADQPGPQSAKRLGRREEERDTRRTHAHLLPFPADWNSTQLPQQFNRFAIHTRNRPTSSNSALRVWLVSPFYAYPDCIVRLAHFAHHRSRFHHILCKAHRFNQDRATFPICSAYCIPPLVPISSRLSPVFVVSKVRACSNTRSRAAPRPNCQPYSYMRLHSPHDQLLLLSSC